MPPDRTICGTLEPRTLVIMRRVIDLPSLIRGCRPVREEIGSEGRGRTPGGLGVDRAPLGRGAGTASDRLSETGGNLSRHHYFSVREVRGEDPRRADRGDLLPVLAEGWPVGLLDTG